jgi:hypothetical protein
MATAGVNLIKSFLYRGNVEEWGNGYHFVGDPPSDHAGWLSLVEDLVAIEKATLPGTVSYERAYCYPDFSPGHDAAFTIEKTEFGSPLGSLGVTSGSTLAPGDAAVWVRWKTARTNTHGKPIYLRKYFHGAIITSDGSDADTIEAAQVTSLGVYAGAIATSSGAWPGIAGPDGVAPGAHAVSPFVTTRTLRRRGRRPS